MVLRPLAITFIILGGHYNGSKTVSENLKLSSALLSRFDLTFILLGKFIVSTY